MKILVTGSRSWTDKEQIKATLLGRVGGKLSKGLATIIHGGANGADSLANEVALEYGWDTVIYPANWQEFGRSAGVIRNAMMLDMEKPDYVIAFWDGKSRGTKHMIDYAEKKGYDVHIVRQ